MIVCTNGKEVVSTYNDIEWSENAQYQEHPGVTNAFRCNPKLVSECLGSAPSFTPWSHEQVESVAIQEVPFSVEYT